MEKHTHKWDREGCCEFCGIDYYDWIESPESKVNSLSPKKVKKK